MPTLRQRLIAILVASCLGVGCRSSTSQDVAGAKLLAEGLVPYSPGQPASITQCIDVYSRKGDYFLLYCVSENGGAIETRFRGPSEPVGAPLGSRTEHEGDWHSLSFFVPWSDFQIPVAKWRTDAAGQIAEAYIRTKPFIEWRVLDIKDFQIKTQVEWRPLVDGVGVGEWRQ